MTSEITKRLEHEKIGRLLLHYAIPAVVGTMVNSLYNIVDRVFIGHGVGSLAISGLTLTFPILLFLQAFGMLIGTGTATRVSIFLGRKEQGMAEHILGNALTLTFIITFAAILPSMLFMEEMLYLFGGSEQIIPYAKDYLNIVIPASIFPNLSFSFNAVMRASGYPRKAMITMLIGAFLNIILDPIFIFVFDMGIRGAAIATVISMIASSAFVMHHFISKESLIRFHKKYLSLDKRLVWSIITIGISPFAMQLAGSLVNVVMNHALQSNGGDLALGANGIISSIGMLLVMLVIGLAQGMQPIVGFNYGAGHHRRVMETVRLVIITSTCIMTIGWAFCFFFPEIIVKGFTTDPELVAIAANGLKLNLGLFIVVGSQITISQFFQSIGIAWKAIFLSLTRQFIYLIPTILFLPSLFGLDGVWYSGPISDGLAAVTAWLFLWQHVKKVKRA
ncbi:putative MATE family efflux protein [Parabacteroides sp. PF5-5]|uniref:MATE family efflux transporter n=1 Tax=unclassified Parabacteroides TaxID=2649774 RepID=UPI0024754C1D|nr:MULTISPECIES: MATE family efflux transporter [unclassified Parabacteroides]MDH6303560.1 putative MATE family efflux protein [Parabacteroides sp. PH5-39]MDH6314882.1 putative MATE family efflux protein [Parabacteroides sp. PF5-13]MDH6318219.1 putative MATE family efflux protein [Parabacteroides sp. PH5-13]MDH6321848.1 putative MATE family efflux protein [Parabacteroides sp. PH5-8]MDH6325972.1 putative MATE family efflux protein [Parabacteroides sp. PH5-41]